MRKYGTAVLGLMFALSLGGCGEGERTVYVAQCWTKKPCA